jgi:hypothetical protein
MTRFLMVPVAAIAFLLIGAPYAAVCECQVSLFISKLDDSWVRYLNREGVGQRLPQTRLGQLSCKY